jgi:hypothetical protein
MRTTCDAQKPYAAAMISIAWKSMIQDADSGDSRGNGGSRLWAISLGTFFLALKRKFLGGRTKTAKLEKKKRPFPEKERGVSHYALRQAP